MLGTLVGDINGSIYQYKFLIDSILSSKIFNNQKAESLIKRIQALSGKGLSDITKYAKTY